MKEFESKTILTDEIKTEHNGNLYVISAYKIETPIGEIFVVNGANADMSINELYCGTEKNKAITYWRKAKKDLFDMIIDK